MKSLILVEHSEVAMDVFPSIQRLGYKIVYLGNSLALKKCADRHLPFNPGDGTADFLKKHEDQLRTARPAGVISFVEHCKQAELEIAEFLGLPHVSQETLNLSRDKNLMRQALAVTNLNSVAHRFISPTESSPATPFSYPFIVKPNLGYASGGVQLVHNQSEFADALKVVRRLNKFVLGARANTEAGVLCEEFIDGPEFSIDSLTADGETRVFCVCGRGFIGEENFQDYIYFAPPELPEGALLDDLQEMISQLMRVIGYTNGPAHTEVRYDFRRQRWCLLESGLRVGFSGNIGVMYSAISGLDYNALAVQAALGQLKPEDLKFLQPAIHKHGVVFTPGTGSGGIVKEIRGENKFQKDPRITSMSLQKKIGDVVTAYPKGLEYLGSIVGVTDSRPQLMTLIGELSKELEFIYER